MMALAFVTQQDLEDKARCSRRGPPTHHVHCSWVLPALQLSWRATRVRCILRSRSRILLSLTLIFNQPADEPIGDDAASLRVSVALL